MTKKKRKHKNWVEVRANCTQQGVFDRIVDVLGTDVKRFNALAKRKKKAIRFYVKPFAQGKFIVRPGTDEGVDQHYDDYVLIHLQKTCIAISRRMDPQFTIEPKWNEERLDCDLMVCKKRLSLSRISQKAIGDLLFDNEFDDNEDGR